MIDQKLSYPGFAKLKEAVAHPLASTDTKIRLALETQKRNRITEQIRRSFRIVSA